MPAHGTLPSVPDDDNHQLRTNGWTAMLEPLLTTDYVVDETLTLC